jgi:DNA-directed RNA polymerase subunit RPC12/RpoP
MAIKVKKPAEVSEWPKPAKCNNCGAELEIESYKDVSGDSGTQYNESYTNLHVNCPVCNSRVALNEEDFSQYEVRLICQATSYKNTQDYYNK